MGSTIIFHISRSLKSKQIELPRYIGFSGTASKILNILSTSKNTLSDFTKIIFEIVYDSKFDKNGIDLIIDANPKETTCKGGLLINNNYNNNIEKNIYVGEIEKDYNEINYNNILNDNDILKCAENEYLQFVDFLSLLNNKFNFYEHFNSISNIDNVTELLKKDILQSIKEGLEIRKSELADTNTYLNETLFFYPLIKNLYSIIQNI